mmetsp:Transcript_25982/g.72932  ORF Transcript_25982/g.72932 Transcript_25982/m.72932 type:complete len:294 (-) Transcript_25982:155-1036(-)
MAHRRAAAAACAALVAIAAAAPLARAACSWDSKAGATYDLSPLKNPHYYRVLDIDMGNDGSRNYTYAFNVCDNLGSTPRSPNTPESSCEKDLPSPALQLCNNCDDCQRLGADNAGGKNQSFGLFDPKDPSRGVTLTYGFGDDAGCGGDYRKLKLAFICADDTANSFDVEEFVEETAVCQYEIFLQSAYGCPKECPIVNGHICNNHGVCGYNQDRNAAQCFCNQGWKGADCTAQGSADGGGITGTGVVLIIVCILLAGVIAAVVFMFLKLRRLKVDPNSFSELKGLYNELGQIA